VTQTGNPLHSNTSHFPLESGNCFGAHGTFDILQPQGLLMQSLPIWKAKLNPICPVFEN